MPTDSFELKSENFQSGNVTFSITQSSQKMTVFDIIFMLIGNPQTNLNYVPIL